MRVFHCRWRAAPSSFAPLPKLVLKLVLTLVPALVMLGIPMLAKAALTLDETIEAARSQAPSLQSQQSTLAGAQLQQRSAATLPDPRLTVGVDNLPISGADRLSLTRDFMTMQRLGLMQEVPNRAKREARSAVASARVDRERSLLAVAQLAVKREATLAWTAVFYAERRASSLNDLERENRILQDTLDARVASGKAMPVDRTMARLEALALADRRDDAQRDVAKARVALRRWVGARADEALGGTPPANPVQPDAVRSSLHRHADVAPYAPMRAVAQAEAGEAATDARGDWAWEVAYSRRGAQYGDMVSFQFSFDLPWQKGQRQQPQIVAKQKEVLRVEAEREETLRRHGEEIEAQLAELQALSAQRDRLAGSGQPLATERVALAMASYQAGRGDLAGVLTARREAAETRLRLIELDAQRAALRVRLTTLIAEQ